MKIRFDLEAPRPRIFSFNQVQNSMFELDDLALARAQEGLTRPQHEAFELLSQVIDSYFISQAQVDEDE